MKVKRAISILAGIFNLVIALGLVVIIALLLGEMTDCMGFVGSGGETGNEQLGAMGLIITGPFIALFFLIGIAVFAVPLVFLIIGSISLLKANGKKYRSTAPVIFIIIICIGVLVYAFGYVAVQFLKGNEIMLWPWIAACAVAIVDLIMCSVSLSLINAQNRILRENSNRQGR